MSTTLAVTDQIPSGFFNESLTDGWLSSLPNQMWWEVLELDDLDFALETADIRNSTKDLT